jgi:arsenate reductase
MKITIYHNPDCGTSRNTLAMIRNAGLEPEIIEYLTTPPSRAVVAKLIASAGLSVRAAMRVKGTPFTELGLADMSLSDDQLLNAIEAHPILLNRPFVVSPTGVKLCRPSEEALDLLPTNVKRPFAKEDGEVVIDEQGNRVKSNGT